MYGWVVLGAVDMAAAASYLRRGVRSYREYARRLTSMI